MTCRHPKPKVTSTDYGWTMCVAPWRFGSEAAHGNIETVDICECGAVRRSESNGRKFTTTGWLREETER